MTDSLIKLKCLLGLVTVLFLSLAIFLWLQTPELFEYFNQAFCAH